MSSCSPAQLPLAWVLHQGNDVVPIPGTTKIKNLDSNIDSLKYGHPRFQADNLEKSKIIYSRIQKLAEKHRCSTAQLSLAWIRGQGDDVVPIPEATKVKNLDDNIESFKVRLTKEDVKEISDMVPVDAAAGNNVPEIFIPCSWKFADTPQRDGGRPS
ncbi:hypothetical protein EV2_010884 [Malus domestica]